MAHRDAHYGTMVQRGRATGEQHSVMGCIPLTNCCAIVPEDQFYAVERFGSFDQVIDPGLHYIGCDLLGVCVTFRSITRRVEQNQCAIETKTKDNVFVMVHVAVQQSVIPELAKDAIYKLANVDVQIDSYVSDVVRSHVPKMTLDEAFENKDEISQAIQEQLTKHMRDYGFMIHTALVTELRPSPDVVSAMNEINKQRRLRDAAVMAAEAEKIKIVAGAEAQCEAARLQGEGIAQQRAAIVEGLKQSIASGTSERLSSDRVSELLLITQYFETLQKIGASSKCQAIFLPQDQNISDVASQIRTGVMQGGLLAAGPEQPRMR